MDGEAVGALAALKPPTLTATVTEFAVTHPELRVPVTGKLADGRWRIMGRGSRPTRLIPVVAACRAAS